MKRVFLIILDSFGIGNAPDAESFGDLGANTLESAYKTGKLIIPEMKSLGLGNIDGVRCLGTEKKPKASYAALVERSLGKDTTTGHWELMGLVSERPMPTYPDGFPDEVIREFENRVGRGTLCNLPYSGTDVIRDYGEEHLKTGKLIVYTSADSVFQIAAHEELVPPEELYRICRVARELLCGAHGVGRVIARPFIGKPGCFTRTENRRDFSLIPPRDTALDLIKTAGLDVIGVGKIGDIFAMKGLTESYPTHNNSEGMAKTSELVKRDFHGLLFVNLVDFDMLYGHRQNADGYADALSAFDAWLREFLGELGEDDMLLITADHGCDPSDDSTDHTRERVPLLVYHKGDEGRNLGTVEGFSYVARTVTDALGVKNNY